LHPGPGSRERRIEDCGQPQLLRPFLDFFASVSDHTNSACAAALIHRTRVTVEDVATNYLFVDTPALEVMLMVNRGGRLMGVLSICWRRPLPGMPYDPVPIDSLAVHLADLLEALETKPEARRSGTS
jgi:hypothetical protein